MEAKTIIRRRSIEMVRRVGVPFEAAADVVKFAPELVLGDAAGGRELLGLDLHNGLHLGREVRVGLGTAFEEDGAFVLPFWLEAVTHAHLFPTFHGGLELRPSGDGLEISLVGSYRPPLGAVGRFADAVAGHLIVTGSLESLLEAAAERLKAATQTA